MSLANDTRLELIFELNEAVTAEPFLPSKADKVLKRLQKATGKRNPLSEDDIVDPDTNTNLLDTIISMGTLPALEWALNRQVMCTDHINMATYTTGSLMDYPKYLTDPAIPEYLLKTFGYSTEEIPLKDVPAAGKALVKRVLGKPMRSTKPAPAPDASSKVTGGAKGKRPRLKISDRDLHAFLKACHNGDVKAVREKLDAGLDPDILQARTGRTPLTAAASDGQAEVVKLLLKAGADPNKGWKASPPRATPLELACAGGHLQTARVLVRHGVDVNSKGYWTPLKTAASHNQSAIIKFLLASGAEPDDSSFLLAARSGCVEGVRLLVKAGIDVHVTTDDGTTALHMAAYNSSPELLKCLLKVGANPNCQTFNFRETPLHKAAQQGRLENIRLLIEAGADIAVMDHKGRIPEQDARWHEETEAADLLKSHRSVSIANLTGKSKIEKL